jgi:Raf kinase inhibitor-like YbhB/YbcL family protein
MSKRQGIFTDANPRRTLRRGPVWLLVTFFAIAVAIIFQPACSRQPGVTDARSSATANTFSLCSPDVADGGTLPTEFTGDGDGVTPPLEWTHAPSGTRSYALIMHHTDAQNVTYSYWILFNIPADVQSLPKDVKGIGTLGLSSRGNHIGYTPPHSAGPGTKTYVFTLYALSAPPQFTVPPSEVSREALIDAMKDITLASADLSVTYTR